MINKYQKVSDYQWQQCPNEIYNSIKVIGVMILVFAFLMIIVVINIRKSKESDMSVLLRILTNYVQLITASISGNIKYPDAITSIFSPAGQVGGSSDTFLSFDWFFSYNQVIKVFSSVSIFKLFLTGTLPLVLTMLSFWTLMSVYFIKKNLFPSIWRNLIISFISILLLLHPKLASSSLSIFQWVQIDSTHQRVRIDTSIECYSLEHLKWWFLIGFPILAVWVVSIPAIGLFLLFKNIHRGSDNRINRYFLILYQGLKKNIFYWEFVNSLRKVLILIFFALLITYPTFYRISASIVVLVISIRLQIYLKPYKKEENNKIELSAITAGTITLLSGVVFEDQSGESTLQNLVLVFVIFVNSVFILNWLYLFSKCMGEDYKIFNKVKLITIYHR